MKVESGRENKNIYFCSLLGILAEKHYSILTNLLNGGLTENYKQEEDFVVHELVYFKDSTPVTSASELRVRRHGDFMRPDSEASWTIRHFGMPLEDLPDAPLPTVARPLVEVEINENPHGLLEGLGYQLMFEYVLDGFRWHVVDVARYDWLDTKRDAKTDPPDIYPYYITICLPIRVTRTSTFEIVRDQQPTKLFDDGFVVELFGYARDKDVNALTKELDMFANKLVPTVNLLKLDGSNLQQLRKIIDSRGASASVI